MRATTLSGAARACIVAALVAASFACVASAASTTAPPNGVYTCSWIATHPAESLVARVTCDPTVFALATAPDAVATLTTGVPGPTSGGVRPYSSACTYIPNVGNIGQGVFGWSGYEYTNNFDFTPTYTPVTYTYYVQKSGGVAYTSGNEYDQYTHSVGLPTNIYRWGVQNRSSQANNWYLCYSG
jgi:hypothetical protein